jgi:chemotaxis protein CheD
MRRILWKAGVLLHGEAVGGNSSRTVRLEIGSGKLWLQEAGTQRELFPAFQPKG